MADDGGITRFQRKMRNVGKAMGSVTVSKAMTKQANDMATTMRVLAPVKSGDLKGSIEVTPGGQSTPPYSQPGGSMTVPETAVAITAGNSDVRYAHLVEYGTTKAPAQPFFWPAVRLHGKRARKAIKSAIGRAVRKEWAE